MVALSAGDRRPFLAQEITDLSLRDGHFELSLKHLGQFLLGQGWVLPLLVPQPGSSLWRPLGSVAMTMVNQGFPGSSSLSVAAAQFGHIVPAVRKPQFFTELPKVLSLLKSLEKLLLC